MGVGKKGENKIGLRFQVNKKQQEKFLRNKRWKENVAKAQDCIRCGICSRFNFDKKQHGPLLCPKCGSLACRRCYKIWKRSSAGSYCFHCEETVLAFKECPHKLVTFIRMVSNLNKTEDHNRKVKHSLYSYLITNTKFVIIFAGIVVPIVSYVSYFALM